MTKQRNLLFVTNMDVWNRTLGAHTRMAEMIDLLSRRYHVAKVAIGNDLKSLGPPADWIIVDIENDDFQTTINHPKFQEYFSDIVRQQKVDVAYFNYVFFAPLAESLPEKITKVCDIHDVQHLRAQSFAEAGHEAPIQVSKDIEFNALKTFDTIVSINPNESEYLRKHVDTRVITIPHIADIVPIRFKSHRHPLVMGSASKPNRDGVKQFILPALSEGILKSPVLLAGAVSRVAQLDDTGLLIPMGHFIHAATIYPYASVSIAPLRFGGGLKIKVIESLAHGVPVAGTKCAFDGIPDLPADIFFEIKSHRDLAKLPEFISRSDNERVREFAADHYAPIKYVDQIDF